VQRFLNLIQGCGADIVLGGRFHPPHILNRNPIVERTPIRELTFSGPRTTLLIGYGATQLRFARVLADFLVLLTPEQTDRLVMATSGATSPVLGALVASLETLGESCKPHEHPARLLLISSALEMLVGARWSGDVSYRGQNAAVAERATFLVGGTNMAERLRFDRRVRDLYGKGSGVRHGDRPEVSRDEVVELASVARQVAIALLDRADSIRTREDLDTWVQQMRYSP
jgi:hypothetical protein